MSEHHVPPVLDRDRAIAGGEPTKSDPLTTGCVIRAGDIVHHEPTGEDWVVAYVDGEYLAWCGWPAGEARLIDCRLKKSCSDEEHLRWLLDLESAEGKRGRMAGLALERLSVCQRPEDER